MTASKNDQDARKPGTLPLSTQPTFQQGGVSFQFGGYQPPITVQPNDPDSFYRRGAELKAQGRLADALSAFDQAIALRPDHAEAHNSRGIVLASLNRSEQALAAFETAAAFRPDYAEAYNNRAIVLQDMQRPAEALDCFERAIALKPDNPRMYNNRGESLHALGRTDEALASYDKAIALKPDFAEAHYNRAIVLKDIRKLEDALSSFEQAIALKPDYAEAYNNRGVVLQDLMRLDDALASFDKALKLAPDTAEVRINSNRGVTLQDLKRLDEALASYDQAIALRPDDPEVYTNKSYCLLMMGRYADGWRLHEWRKKTAKPVGSRSFPQSLWLGTDDIARKTVFIHSEQGLGDTLQFCRYAGLVAERGANVVMSVQEPLYRLLHGMTPAVSVIHQHETPDGFDYHCPLMSLPLAFGTTLETVPQRPYIFADVAVRDQWAGRLPPRAKPRIGIVWSGSARQKTDYSRSVELATFAALFAADAHWISLQKEVREGDRMLLEQLTQRQQMVHFGDELTDFADTAAIIDALDLVITVDTSVAHLAGAMGKQLWILLAYNADWRWLADRDDCPWYPTARLFRQPAAGVWPDVIARVRAAFADLMGSR